MILPSGVVWGKLDLLNIKLKEIKTPIGNFKLDSIYFRKDRGTNPKVI